MKKKKVSKKKTSKEKEHPKKKSRKKSAQSKKKAIEKKVPTLKIHSEKKIATDFGIKVYKTFDKLVKSIVLFGSIAKKTSVTGSDIDIIIIIDDVSINLDAEVMAWYREELDRVIKENPYEKSLHINTIKLSSWWRDIMRGDPIVLNILRNGEAIVDMAGFFTPLKFLLIKGEIKPTPEAIHSCLQRAPIHLYRSKTSELSAVEGVYWAMVDSAHAALIAARVSPPSPEHIADELKINFVDKKLLKQKYVDWYSEVLNLHKKISHGKVFDLRGVVIDDIQDKAEEFIKIMSLLIRDLLI